MAELKAFLNFLKKRDEISHVPSFPKIEIEDKPLVWLTEEEIIIIKKTFSHRRLVETPKEKKWKVLPMLPHIRELLLDLYKNRKKRSEFVFIGNNYSQNLINPYN